MDPFFIAAGIWGIIGFVAILCYGFFEWYNHIDITVDDLQYFIVAILLGPITIIYIVGYFLADHKNTVLIKGRKS